MWHGQKHMLILCVNLIRSQSTRLVKHGEGYVCEGAFLEETNILICRLSKKQTALPSVGGPHSVHQWPEWSGKADTPGNSSRLIVPSGCLLLPAFRLE